MNKLLLEEAVDARNEAKEIVRRIGQVHIEVLGLPEKLGLLEGPGFASGQDEPGGTASGAGIRRVAEKETIPQIRVHLAASGHSIVGDGRYGRKKVGKRFVRLLLHAHVLSFTHPATRERVEFLSPLPEEFVRFMNER